MVRATIPLFKHIPDWYLLNKSGGSYFKKQAQLYMTRYTPGRGWNSYKHAVNRYMYKLKGENYFQKLNSQKSRDVMRSRIAAGCEEHDYQYSHLVTTLPKIDVNLNLHSLATLAVYEPKAFETLVEISKRASEGDHDPLNIIA